MTKHKLFFELLHAGRWLKGHEWDKDRRVDFYRHVLIFEAVNELRLLSRIAR